MNRSDNSTGDSPRSNFARYGLAVLLALGLGCGASAIARAASFWPSDTPVMLDRGFGSDNADAIYQVSGRFSDTMKARGMTGVVNDLKACYNAADATDKADIPAMQRCVMYDSVAYRFLQSAALIYEAQGFSKSVFDMPYFSDTALMARTKLYIIRAFPDMDTERSATFSRLLESTFATAKKELQQ